MSGHRKRPLVNLTPLIDVVFILLVFFMLASDLTRWRYLELALPATAEHRAADRATTALVVTVTRSTVLLDGSPVADGALAERLLHAARPGRRLAVVAVGRGVPVQRVVSVTDQLAAAGLTELHLQRALQ